MIKNLGPVILGLDRIEDYWNLFQCYPGNSIEFPCLMYESLDGCYHELIDD